MSGSSAQPELADQLHAINHRLRRRWLMRLAPFDLSPHQYRALAALARSGQVDDGVADGQDGSRPEGLRLNEIAERLRIAPRSATEVVDLLEEKGLVRRGPDPQDRRASRVTVTEDGRALHARLREQRIQQTDDFFGVLTDAERAELSRLLASVLQESRHGEGEDPPAREPAPAADR